jgi:hypothetical protein
MANENQINPAGNIDPKQLTSALKDVRQGQGDFQDSIRDSVRELNKVVSSYEKIKGTLDSLKTSTININRIEKELERSKAKQIVQSNKVKELEDKIGQDGKRRATDLLKSQNYIKKLEEDISKARATGNKQALKASTNLLNSAESYLDTLKDQITPQEASYAAQLKSLDLSTKQVEFVEEYLQTEKDVAKAVGNTGKFLAFTSKYLGIGKELYAKIVEEAREGETATKKMVVATAALVGTLGLAVKGTEKFAKGISTNLTGTGGPISKLVSPFTDLISKIPIVGGLIGGLVDMLANVADYATEAGSQVQLFARNLGLSVEEATQLNTEYSNVAHNSGDLLYNSRKFRETQMEIAEATGRNNLLSKEALQTQIQLKEIAGIDLETRKQLVDVETVSGVRQDKIVKAAMGTSNFIKTTLGVSIKWQSILKEASSLSGVLGLSFAKYPEKLSRSLATVKTMGLELKQLDSIADSFLDFESSISKEFEAQLLTGKDINLAKAREAFLNNDLVTAGKELVAQLGTSGEFLRYNRIQQDALAAAAGMTKDQVADMLKQQELFSKFQVNDVKEYQKKVALMTQTIEGQRELVGLLGEEEYSKVMSQTATEKIANFIEKIKQSFADLLSSSSFKGFLDKVINFISDPKNIESLLSKITGFISVMIKAVAAVLSGLDQLPFVEIDKGIISSIRGYADELSSAKLGSLSSNIGGVSIGENVASSQVKNSQGAAGSTQDNMSMAKPTVNVINNTKVDAIKGQALTDVAVQWSYGDINSGPQRFQS